jgi:hypothetical protein
LPSNKTVWQLRIAVRRHGKKDPAWAWADFLFALNLQLSVIHKAMRLGATGT